MPRKRRPLALDEMQLMIDMAEDHDTDDRTVAIVCLAHIEDALSDLIRANLPGLTDKLDNTLFAPGRGPLGTFGNKVAVAQASEFIYPDFAAELMTMAKIRNQFAHRLSVDSFTHHDVRDLVDNLAALRESSTLLGIALTIQVAEPTKRRRFVYSAVTAALALNGHDEVGIGLTHVPSA